MKNRRNFIKLTLGTVIAGVASHAGLANAKDTATKATTQETKKESKPISLVGLIYTKDNQGKWDGKASTPAT